MLQLTIWGAIGKGTYNGGSTIVRPRPPKTVRDPKKDLCEQIEELKALFLRMQLNSITAENEIRELKRLLRLVTLNPNNTDTTKDLLSSDDSLIEMILEYLKSIGHKSTNDMDIRRGV